MSDSKEPQAIPRGPVRELKIYALGLSGGKPSVPVPLGLLEQKAKAILPPRAYDYVAGGADGERHDAREPRSLLPLAYCAADAAGCFEAQVERGDTWRALARAGSVWARLALRKSFMTMRMWRVRGLRRHSDCRLC